MENKKLRNLSDKLRNVWEENYVCERGIEHHIIHTPYYKDPIHIEIITHPDQLLWSHETSKSLRLTPSLIPTEGQWI